MERAWGDNDFVLEGTDNCNYLSTILVERAGLLNRAIRQYSMRTITTKRIMSMSGLIFHVEFTHYTGKLSSTFIASSPPTLSRRKTHLQTLIRASTAADPLLTATLHHILNPGRRPFYRQVLPHSRGWNIHCLRQNPAMFVGHEPPPNHIFSITRHIADWALVLCLSR